MKYLIIPSNNSLSHVTKGIALHDSLLQEHHEALIAVGRRHQPFMETICQEYAVLPDIQENDASPFPTPFWFKYPEKITLCIMEEMKLIQKYKPDAVVGIFRYTANVSSLLTETPYYSLICGCMLPENDEPFGFSKNDPGYNRQQFYLDNFNQYSTGKINRALKTMGAHPINSTKNLLKGVKTFLWDFPEFMPLKAGKDVIHVGPISWDKWPYDDYDLDPFMNIPLPLAVLAFGTGIEQKSVTRKMASLLIGSGYKVIIANGRNELSSGHHEFGPYCLSLNFAPLQNIFNHASVLISHGGQLTVFEALRKKVPVVVMSFQPEQDHNGLCLERISCGERLIRHTPFRGDSRVYIDALDSLSDKDIVSIIDKVEKDKMIKDGLTKISLSMAGCLGLETMTAQLKGD